ncbi:MAG: 2-hydroxyacid dehydrogenase [Eubacterium sp.]|nr:2-hydroxyacid dehydrogenase [Eubacterium sp.]MCM1417421.1 2-hydroxyacid dehydrogenase [Roseburia sp.]
MHAAMFDTKNYDREIFEKSTENTEIRLKCFEAKLNEDTAELARNYDAVIAFVNDTISSAVIDTLVQNGVKLIAMRCAGFNNVDVKYAEGKLPIVRVPEYSPYAVAEHAMAMLLTSIRRIHKAYIRTRDFNFSLNGFTGFDLHGKTAGIIGTGKIGRCFINICRGFGMNVIAYDPYPAKDSGIEYVELNELFRRSNIISLHCPLTQQNRHIVNAESIEMMKKGVVLINTSRGALINTDALIAGIKSKKIGAACLDVYEEESDIFFEDYSGHIVQDDTLARLITLPNVLITSHQAFLTEEALGNIAETTVENIVSFFRDHRLTNEVRLPH